MALESQRGEKIGEPQLVRGEPLGKDPWQVVPLYPDDGSRLVAQGHAVDHQDLLVVAQASQQAETSRPPVEGVHTFRQLVEGLQGVQRLDPHRVVGPSSSLAPITP